MSDKINVVQLIGKHSPLLAAALEHNKPTEINPENVRAFIKDFAEILINKCANNAKTRDFPIDDGSDSGGYATGIDKDSILNVKNLIDYV